MSKANRKDEMDVLKFITCVRDQECIYNKDSADYRNREVVFESWRKIGREMNTSVIELKEKWHNLRSNYMRERKKVIGPGVKRWHLLEALSFLEAHHCARGPTGPRRRRRRQQDCLKSAAARSSSDIGVEVDDFEPPTPLNNVTSTEQFSSLDDDIRKFDFEACNKVDLPSNGENDLDFDVNSRSPELLPQVSMQPPIAMKLKRKRHLKRNDMDFEYLKQVRKLTKQLDQTTEDPDRMFLLSLLPLVKHLSPRDNVNFRVEVQQILQRKLHS